MHLNHDLINFNRMDFLKRSKKEQLTINYNVNHTKIDCCTDLVIRNIRTDALETKACSKPVNGPSGWYTLYGCIRAYHCMRIAVYVYAFVCLRRLLLLPVQSRTTAYLCI